MKLITLILFLSFNAFSFGGFIPLSEFGNKISYVATSQKTCEKDKKETCIKIPADYHHEYSERVDEYADDLNSPIWGTRSMVESCDGETDCKEMAKNKSCNEPRQAYFNAEFTEVWCNEITGYEQIKTGRKIIVVNETKKQAYEASVQAAKQKKVDRETAIENLKTSAISKQWNDLTTVERKILMGLDVTDTELGL